jgi:hypothetical protein
MNRPATAIFPTLFAVQAGLLFALGARSRPPPNPAAQATQPIPTITATATEIPTATATVPSTTVPPIPTMTPTETRLAVETSTPSPSVTTGTAASTSTPSPAYTPTVTPDPTDSPSPTPLQGNVQINEIAWAGTLASPFDEWIELYNPGPTAVDLSGWRLTDGGDIDVALSGILPPFRFYLLERTDDTTISDLPAQQIYTGGLSNSGEVLLLQDPAGGVIDTANRDGGAWPAGEAGSRASMERRGEEDRSANWGTFTGAQGRGHDSAGNPIAGTPLGQNSFYRTPTPTLPSTAYATHSPTPTMAPSATRSPSPTPLQGSVLINEIGWAGTLASASDEWIELHNPGMRAVVIQGWTLSDGGDISVSLVGALPPGGFLLLERTEDTTISDIPADQIYTGSLNNAGESLWLRDAHGSLIDSANAAGGGWPSGDAASHASMERRNPARGNAGWGTYTGYHGAGLDAQGRPIAGTPRAANSVLFPIPSATPIPSTMVINEVLIRPHHDWNGNHRSNLNDEFIELYNLGPKTMRLAGWILDDVPDAGSTPYTIPPLSVKPGGYLVFFRVKTHISLNDSGDTVRLLAPDGTVVDEIRYLRVKAYNLSYGRMPDGNIHLNYQLWPTPGRANVFFYEDLPGDAFRTLFPHFSACPEGGGPWPLLPPLGREPALVRWLQSLEFIICRD